ncbi:S-adenosyl-L-methionine-dependent methyltransferase [Leucosporidium creatinivorum]|uniref:S-adenosyl-L-methionine-dependent methyltransferase n=1 Tax=Leucosporidium creatinivorum TaxID=106004 RepID=A0A1Y2G000_9BASI|nr:S-adenosyl-L-methionine-dependent methyltransferase [Leucosporidium creatinivorum]
MRFRYLRADHSLLGGLWDIDAGSVETAESIYSTFILQELVRLADSTSHEASGYKSALIIGLGAGLSARALHQHQVEVTIVEIDPVVYDFARRYFAVPKPTGGAFLEDARAFLRRETERRYDYIVHDVFTGGSVPASLFTIECFQDISRALTPTGIVAINFAGNTSSVASQLVFSTILSSFHHCRAFEDGAHTTDYRNLVFFCSPSSPVVFRQPLPSDYLPFPSPLMREKVFNEFESAEMDLSGVKLGSVVHDGSERELEEAQRAGVKEHWELMNGVLPLETWAMY